MIQSLENEHNIIRLGGTPLGQALRACSGPAEYALATARVQLGRDIPQPAGVREDLFTVARVYPFRWLADCPWCPSAHLVAVSDPRWFCVNPQCENGGENGAGGAWIRVKLPSVLQIMQIEALLELRSDWRTRGWDPRPTRKLPRGEAVQDLIEENRQHRVNSAPLQKIVQRYLLERWRPLFGAEAGQILDVPFERWGEDEEIIPDPLPELDQPA